MPMSKFSLSRLLPSRFRPSSVREEADFRAALRSANTAELAVLSRFEGAKEREWIEQRLRIPIHKFADFTSYMETGHKRVWATYRACKLIAATMVSATFKVERGGESADGQRPAVNVEGSVDSMGFAAGGFIERPNPYDTWEELIEMYVFHQELTGNAYWLKDEMDLRGRPSALYPLLPQHMRYTPDPAAKIKNYVYHVNGKEITFEPSQIIHFKQINPVDLHLGMGSIEPSQGLYNSFINKGTLEERFLENGAQPSGILTRDTEEQLDPVQWEKLKAKFVADYTGKKNAGKVAFLNGKWAYAKLGLTMDEMQSIEHNKWNVEQIFLNHGVPLSVAGFQSANYAIARQEEMNFRRYKVVPLLDSFCGRVNADGFIQAAKPGAKIFYELGGLIDVEQIVKDYGPLVDRGCMTRNEMREMVGLPIIDNDPFMDTFTVNGGTVPLDMIGTTAPPDSALLPPEEEDPEEQNEPDPNAPEEHPEPPQPEPSAKSKKQRKK